MAKTSQFTDELLTEAVHKYAEVCKDAIVVTQLAEWARKNIPGLENVRYYVFNRPVKRYDQKTKKNENTIRPCMELINEINESRKTETVLELNPLLNASSIDDFYARPRLEQKQLILKTREQVEVLQKENKRLSLENARLLSENKLRHQNEEKIEEKIDELSAETERIGDFIRKLSDALDEHNRSELMAQIGYSDQDFDFAKITDSLTLQMNELYRISDSLKPRTKTTNANDLINQGMDWDE